MHRLPVRSGERSSADTDDLMASCTACHEAVNHGVIIMMPQNDFDPDQDFQLQRAP